MKAKLKLLEAKVAEAARAIESLRAERDGLSERVSALQSKLRTAEGEAEKLRTSLFAGDGAKDWETERVEILEILQSTLKDLEVNDLDDTKTPVS